MRYSLLQRATPFVLTVSLIFLSAAASAAEPQLPCQLGAQLDYAPPGVEPKIETWGRESLSAWTPPACSGWSQADSTFLVVLTGSFHAVKSIDAIAQALGAISDLSHVRYWSVTDKEWRPLVKKASALSDADKKDTRADFSPDEMTQGAVHFALEHDSRSGDIVDRQNVVERTDRSIAVASENLTAIRLFIVPLIGAHGLQTIEYVEKAGPDTWHVCVATRILAGRAFVKDHEASYVNRSVALFRYLAGIPSDQGPPAEE